MLYVLVFLLGFLLSGIWFGCHSAAASVISRKGLQRFEPLQPLISGIIPTTVICICGRINIFQIDKAADPIIWGAALLSVAAASSIILIGTDRKKERDILKLMPKCIEAAFMEIPQRAMMQSFIEMLLIYFGLNSFKSILITALVWCAAQMVQLLLLKQRAAKAFWAEMLASFVFSIGIGYVFWASKSILIAMLCHGAERFVTNRIGRQI